MQFSKNQIPFVIENFCNLNAIDLYQDFQVQVSSKGIRYITIENYIVRDNHNEALFNSHGFYLHKGKLFFMLSFLADITLIQLTDIYTENIAVVSKKGDYKLLPFQEHTVKVCKLYKWNLTIASEPGLGKTIMSLFIIENLMAEGLLNEQSIVIIVCPKSVKEMWRDYLRNFNFKTKVKFIVTHFEEIIKMPVVDTDLIIVDEAHKCKNYMTSSGKYVKRTKAIIDFCQLTKYKIFLSGTLLPNRIEEIFVFASIFGKIKCSQADFLKANFNWGRPRPDKENYLKRLYNSFIIRHCKKDVLLDLPDKVITEIKVDSKDIEFNALVQKLQKVFNTIGDDKEFLSYLNTADSSEDNQGMLQRYRVMSEKMKMPFVIEKIDEIVGSGNKVILFCYSREVQKEIFTLLSNQHGTGAVSRIHADMNPIQRNNTANEFQSNPNIKIVVCSLFAAGEGINLFASSNVIFSGLDWVAGNMEQCEDRAHRIGQKDSVNVYRFVVSFIDSLMLRVVERKNRELLKIQDKTESSQIKIKYKSMEVESG